MASVPFLWEPKARTGTSWFLLHSTTAQLGGRKEEAEDDLAFACHLLPLSWGRLPG